MINEQGGKAAEGQGSRGQGRSERQSVGCLLIQSAGFCEGLLWGSISGIVLGQVAVHSMVKGVAMILRVWLVLVCLIAFNGCYTQIRPPGVQEDPRVDAPLPPSDVSVQQFEYYHHQRHHDYCDPFDLRSVPFYEPCLPRSYTRYPPWRRNRLVWEYSCWATVYDPWWRGYPPRILIPQIVYASAVRSRVVEREEQVAQPNPRPNVRHTGLTPASASTVRTGSTTTKSTPSTQSTGSSGSTKTQPPPKKKEDEDKSGKREEKRTEPRRRGGMR